MIHGGPRRGTENTFNTFDPRRGAGNRAIASKFGRHNGPRRAPTRGAPTDCQSFSDKKPSSSRQRRREFAIAHYDLHSSRRLGLGRATTRGASTDCLLSAFGPAKGTHKGCPYRLASLGVLTCEGHPQGVPLPIGFSRRLDLRRDEFSVPAVRFVKSGQLQVIIFVLILLHGRPASAREFGRTLSANATCQRRKICKARHGAQS